MRSSVDGFVRRSRASDPTRNTRLDSLDDPTAALLTMGIDDAAVLRMASKMLENPQQSLAKLNNLTCAAASAKTRRRKSATPC